MAWGLGFRVLVFRDLGLRFRVTRGGRLHTNARGTHVHDVSVQLRALRCRQRLFDADGIPELRFNLVADCGLSAERPASLCVASP